MYIESMLKITLEERIDWATNIRIYHTKLGYPFVS